MITTIILRLAAVLLVFILFAIPVLSGTAQYTYDNLNRLVKVQYDNGTVIQYTYDAVGNRLTQEVQAFSGDAAAAGGWGAGGAPVSLALPAPVSSPPSGTASQAGTPPKKDAAAGAQGPKILQDHGKIYTSGPVGESEKVQP